MLRELKLGVMTRTATSWPVYSAERQGFFADLGLTVSVTPSGNDPKVHFDRLLSGTYDISHQNPDHALRACVAGVDVRILLRLMRPLYSLVVKPDVDSYDDLRSKPIVVDEIDTGFGLLLQRMLAAHGVNRDECNFIVAGVSRERLRVMHAGQASAGLFEPSSAAALVNKGFKILDSSWDYLQGYLGPVAITTESWLQANRTVARDYLRGYIKGTDWLLDPTNRSEAAGILADNVDVSLQDAEVAYDLIVDRPGVYDPRAEITREELEGLARVGKGTRALLDDPDRLARLYDPSVLAEAIAVPA